MNLNFESIQSSRAKLLDLIAGNAYRHGEFTLSSGKKSNHYVNCKPVTLSGQGLLLVSQLMLEKVDSKALAVAGITLGGDPLVSSLALMATQAGRPMDALIVRKEPKGYGTAAWLEGPLPPVGSLVTVLEDVVTTGGSALKAVKQLQAAGYVIKQIIAIVDRQEGGAVEIQKAGLDLVSLFLIDEISKRFDQLVK